MTGHIRHRLSTFSKGLFYKLDFTEMNFYSPYLDITVWITVTLHLRGTNVLKRHFYCLGISMSMFTSEWCRALLDYQTILNLSPKCSKIVLGAKNRCGFLFASSPLKKWYNRIKVGYHEQIVNFGRVQNIFFRKGTT